jgi:ElaB/YqjD/DUF883 family membrane-anchored ribosome-binding protein
MNNQDNAGNVGVAPQSANGQGAHTVRASAVRSAGRALEVLETHPYFTAGVVTGIGLAVGAGLLLRARRRRSFIEDFLRRF